MDCHDSALPRSHPPGEDQASGSPQGSLPGSPGATPSPEFLGLVERLWPAKAAPPQAGGSGDPEGTSLGRFRLGRVLGTGSFGIVYLATDESTQSLVALKVPHPGVLLDAALRERFLREARAASALIHPNLVPVQEAGQVGPVCYLVSPFIEGPTLAAWLEARSTLPEPAECARLVRQLAAAMAHAHARGIFHCDLKPANILMQPPGPDEGPLPVPRITDFGLAQVRGDAAVSQSDQVIGTPLYMAPEQALGRRKELTPATDVYALGVILYELLTGTPPFVAEDPGEVCRRIIREAVEPPSRKRPGIPAALEAVCLVCLEKNPADRYARAADLAADLERFLAGKRVRAFSLRRRARLRRAGRRLRTHGRRWLAAAGLATLVGLALWSLVGELASTQREHEEAHAEAQAQESLALLHRARERTARPTPGWTAANRDDLRRAVTPTSGTLRAALRSALAETLAGADLLLRGEAAVGLDAHAVAFSPDGNRLALGEAVGGGKHVEVWLVDPADGHRLGVLRAPAQQAWQQQRNRHDGIRSLAFSRDGRWLAAGTRSGWVHCWDVTGPAPSSVSWPAHSDTVFDLAFLPDGSALLSLGNDGQARRWRPESGERLPGEVSGLRVDSSLALSPDGTALALSPQAAEPYWFRPDLSRLDRPGGNGHGVHRAVHPSGLFLVRTRHRVMEFVDTATGQTLRDVHPDGATEAHGEDIESAVFSPDGRLLVTASRADARLRLWECVSGRLVLDLHLGGGTALPAFSPDGRTLAATGPGRTLLFDVANSQVLTVAAVQSDPIDDLALCPETARLVCLVKRPESTRENLSRWDLDRVPAVRDAAVTFDLPAAVFARVAAAPGAERAAFLSGEGVHFWHPPERVLSRLPQEGALALALGPDGRLWLATGGGVQVWDRQLQPGGTWRNRPPPGQEGVGQVHALAAGRGVVLAGTRDGHLHVLSADGVRALASCRVAESPVRAVALSPDESRAAAASATGEVVVLDLPGGTVRGRWPAHADAVAGLAFAGPDLLATGGLDRAVRLWWLGAGEVEEVLTLPQPAAVQRLGFTADGRLVVLLEQERGVRVWDLGQLQARLAELGLALETPLLPAVAPNKRGRPPEKLGTTHPIPVTSGQNPRR
jgi:WD40 repeat protein